MFHLRIVSKHLLAAYPRELSFVHRIETTALALVNGALRPLVRRYPRPSLAEYEQLLDSAICHVGEAEGRRVVLLGPGGFNPDQPSYHYPSDAVQIYEQVNAMVKRVAAAHGIPLLDRMAIGGGTPSSGVFLGDSPRYSVAGHQLIGHALAEMVLRHGLM